MPEVVSRLHKIDLSKPPRVVVGDLSPADSNQDPNYLTGVLLEIVLRLKVVEALPELLRLEDALALRLKAAQSAKAASLPALDLDSPVRWKGYDYGSDPKSQQNQLFTVRVYQSELLAVMATLLREERFEPLLRSEIEAHYFDWLKEQAQRPELAKIKRPSDIPVEQRGWITFDPIHDLPVSSAGWWGPACSIPNTPQTRLEIRKLVKDFLQLDPAKRSGDSTRDSTKK